ARLGQVMTMSFDVLEEGEDQRSIQLFDLKRRGRDPQPFGGKAHQQLEGIRVRLDGVRTDPPIARQIFAEEGFQIRSERINVGSPVCKVSPARAICCMSVGVACRYQ